MKKKSSLFCHVVKLLAVVAAGWTGPALYAAGPFTVNTTTDSHASAPATSASDGTGHISLRSAIEAASAQGGTTTINIPVGTYNLTLGELDVASNGSQTNTFVGAGAASTIVSQTDGVNRVFNIDFNSGGRTITTLSGLTIQGGHDAADLDGGAGILAGSVSATPKDVLTLNNCVVQNNHCTTNSTEEVGGGIQMAGGDLDLTGCTFSNNSSGQSFGGAVYTLSQTVISSLNATNCTFSGNTMTNNSGAGPDGGGAIMIETVAGSVHNLIGCTFTNNRVYGISGDTVGGAVQMNGGTLNIDYSVFTGNLATGTAESGGQGGAIFNDSGTINLSFCRLVGNTATYGGGALFNHGSNGATTTAVNNWWGCDGGPGAAGCDVASGDGTTLTDSPWLFITNSASPGTINDGQSTTLTASVLKNSANTTLTTSQVAVLLGLPLTWSAGAHGSLSGTQTTIQASGLATATFLNDGTCNNGVPSVTLDNGTSVATVVVQCPDLTIVKSDNVSGSVALGNGWIWNIHVSNPGPASATFANGNAIILDNLPNAGIVYSSPVLANLSGVNGTLVPGVNSSSNLFVTASGAITLNAGASFDVKFTALASATGTYGNPRSGGVCVVDPTNVVPESNEANNSAADSVVVTCPTITGTVSGSTSICPNGSAVVTVSISGGVAPYTVTLNNSGGTQSGPSPLLFAVNPAVTTAYQISSGTDADGCPVGASGTATVTLNPEASPLISLNPSSVLANSEGNQASVPAGQAGYAWTISNGFIIGPTNLPTVTYDAGTSNTVVLGVTVFNATGCSASSSAAVPDITGFSMHTNVTFKDGLGSSTMGMSFDGTNYMSISGGTTTGTRFATYDSMGAVIASAAPGLDFRSLMIRADGTVFARQYSSGVIYQQTTPGVFVASPVTLTGGTLNPQASLVLDNAGDEYQALNAGAVSSWSTNGTYLGSVTLAGFGNLAGETGFPQNCRLAAMGNFWLTYNGAGILSIWTTNGTRISQLTLPGAGTTLDSAYSLSYCNGKVFIVDVGGGTWRAFDLNPGAAVLVLAAESQTYWLSDVTNKITGVGSLPRADMFSAAVATPTLAQLRAYQAVMVFSDNNFFDPVGMGNLLADYVDQGGGVVMQTFCLVTNTANESYATAGRISTNGYMPFIASGTSYPANLTMVENLPSHPLLNGVSTFTDGSISYENNGISTNAGSTVVSHLSDGTPLEGTKPDGFGTVTALNFFPPSSSVNSPSWVSSSTGARLMANALVWSGKIPPTIVYAPASQTVPPGATATFTVNAQGISPLGYQWRLNGTNLPAATNATLSFTVQNNSGGAYSVVVTNLNGATTSLSALLNPQLLFLTPAVTNGNFSLYLVDADGSAVNTNRAPRVSLYSSTNLLLPFPFWQLLTNPVIPSGTQLRADGFTTTNSTLQFYRALELP